ncbi:inositol-3-phosphate synthase [Photorhabdus tasmaniensis]|uniref:inositol-3-phosphate synthase n=1 Tax=Photorhabdus tasmaniensis TaxID=1004159 RepID=UPI004042BF94
MKSQKKIRVAIAGVGNCASSLVQLVTQNYGKRDKVNGVMNKLIGGYAVEDIEFVAAFDVNKLKIGKDLAEAIVTYPNMTTVYQEVPKTNVKVSQGVFSDGIGKNLLGKIDIELGCKTRTYEDISKILVESKAEVLINYLPVGSAKDTEAYVKAALDAKCAFVNCNPELVATREEWAKQFEEAGVPLLGDDIKSQLGSTMLHRSICQTLVDRGAIITKTYQLNIGGNTDFENMVDRTRSKTKKFTKTDAIRDILGDNVEINVGPSDHISMLNDRKVAYIRIEGTSCLGMNFSVETRLDVEDSPNSAGAAIDAIRAAGFARDKKISGAVLEPSAFLFKYPPKKYHENEILNTMEKWLRS